MRTLSSIFLKICDIILTDVRRRPPQRRTQQRPFIQQVIGANSLMLHANVFRIRASARHVFNCVCDQLARPRATPKKTLGLIDMERTPPLRRPSSWRWMKVFNNITRPNTCAKNIRKLVRATNEQHGFKSRRPPTLRWRSGEKHQPSQSEPPRRETTSTRHACLPLFNAL